MIILTIDTCIGACSAGLFDRDRALAVRSEPMTRGHQERLAPMVEEVFAGAGIAPAEIDRVAVTIGPGSFTGLRVGVAFAKGFASALGAPCLGVGTLEALVESVPAAEGTRIGVVDGKRGQIYAQIELGGAPAQLTYEDAATAWGAIAMPVFVGPGAELAMSIMRPSVGVVISAPDPAAIARLGADKGPAPFKPLYLRAPDAKLPGGITPDFP